MSQRMNHLAVAPGGAKALGTVHGYVSQSGLPKTLIDMVYLRVSHINGCAYCIDSHTLDLLKESVPVEKVTLVPTWQEGGAFFDERERAALAWAETVTRVADTHVPDDAYAIARAAFSEKELADLTIAIGLMNAYNRLAISFRQTPVSVARLAV